jgi:hypothetical protein
VKEQALNFGASGNLSGVLTEPDPKLAVAGAPAAIMWNVGIHHRAGTYRIWVDLSRRLAAEGYTSLRFDLSGMGDSERRPGSTGDVDRKEDLDDAMELVTKRTGLTTFAPMGFCSGVDQLHPLGLRDPRVVGMGYFEAYSWKTRGYYLRFPMRYLRTTLWKDRLTRLGSRESLGVLRPLLKGSQQLAIDPLAAQMAGGGLFSRTPPTRQQFRSDLDALLGRGVNLFFAYFGLETGVTHEGQFEEMTGLPQSDQLVVYFAGGADHTLYRTPDRVLTVGRVAEWMRSRWPRRPKPQ